MVTEMVQCYGDLLVSEGCSRKLLRVSTAQFLEALGSGCKGLEIITDLMCSILIVVMRDSVNQNSKVIVNI